MPGPFPGFGFNYEATFQLLNTRPVSGPLTWRPNGRFRRFKVPLKKE